MPVQLIFADAVIPMEGRRDALLEPSGVAVEGDTIAAVGPRAALQTQFPNAAETCIPGIMLPGLVNAHTHLELGYQRAAIAPPPSFTAWVTALMRNYPAPEDVDAAVTGAVEAGVRESLRAGVTCVGDISRHCRLTRQVLAAGPLRAVSFGEVIGLGKMRGRQEEFLHVAIDRSSDMRLLASALSPHAPYTVEGPTLERVMAAAQAGRFPVTMHLAELREEAAFLESASGPLAEWPVMRNILDADVPHFAGGPLRWAHHWGLFNTNVSVILAHVNYCDDVELALLATTSASVAYCPRTRAYFGHDPKREFQNSEFKIQNSASLPHRYRDMLAAGVNVCLGTDSLASNPDLSVLREAAFVWQRDGIDPYLAMEMITRRGAMALGVPAGVLAAGRLADVAVLPGRVGAGGGEIGATLASVLEEALSPASRGLYGARATWVGGRREV